MARTAHIGASLRETRFVSFDGAVSLTTFHQRPDRYRHLEIDFGTRSRIARGAGLSYAAASFGEDVIVQEMSAFNRLLAFDETHRTVRVEAGMSLHSLLAWARQKNLYLPVLPGSPLITIGGCIAADVHGKNPARDGTFCDWVEDMTIFHPSSGFQRISRADHSPLFEATCGGFGLTGLIVDATLRLAQLPAQSMYVEAIATESLSEAIAHLRAEAEAQFAYSWHDGTARHARFGRGLVYRAGWSDEPSSMKKHRYSPLTALQRGRWPVSLWTRMAARCANTAFLHHAVLRPRQVETAFDAAFPFARQTLYHRFYGRPGLAEVQVLVPAAHLARFVTHLTALVHDFEPPLIMMSLKAFVGRQRSLSMSGAGMLFALDLKRSISTSRFIAALDLLTLEVGGQPNAGKDSRLPADIAARSLPNYADFRQRIRQFDASRLYQSELSRRLEL